MKLKGVTRSAFRGCEGGGPHREVSASENSQAVRGDGAAPLGTFFHARFSNSRQSLPPGPAELGVLPAGTELTSGRARRLGSDWRFSYLLRRR
jgi:hypothetical protein